MLHLETSALFECPCPAGTLEGGGRWPLRGKIESDCIGFCTSFNEKGLQGGRGREAGLAGCGQERFWGDLWRFIKDSDPG